MFDFHSDCGLPYHNMCRCARQIYLSDLVAVSGCMDIFDDSPGDEHRSFAFRALSFDYWYLFELSRECLWLNRGIVSGHDRYFQRRICLG
jgi:hypothetical protein